MTVALISHPDCLLHDMGALHPESPARLWAINDQLIASRLDAVLRHYQAPAATRAQLERVHDPEYVESIFQSAPQHGLTALDPDTIMNPHTLSAALHAAGAAVHAVDLVLRGEATAAFCSVRPPGHHACRNRAMGFCFFNNVAAGAAHALAAHGVERVAILDFDVHHGNGTEDIFGTDPRVLLCSTFQHPFYPYSGTAPAQPHIINVPMAAGTGGAEFRRIVETRWLPALHNFKPQLVMFSAGFDAHRDDDLGQLLFDDADYFWVTDQVKTIAGQYAHGRIVSVLEGGYDVNALGRCVVAHVQALLGATQVEAI
ncbi:MAG: histone deacetylase family protein [Gammaproteobacteria bacterium]|nr:histone deacetylase family protein [Gammaproteobacteria bacterium]